MDRRVRRTQKALRDAFVGLVLERGYEQVSVEDITIRADVARATFYAHYSDKESLLSSLFEEISAELATQVVTVRGAPPSVRGYLVRRLYTSAAAYPDIYRVCLGGAGNGRARAQYTDTIAQAAAQIYSERLHSANAQPRIAVDVMARAFAGAHTALLEAWLADENRPPIDDAVEIQMTLLTNGYAWALTMIPDDHVAGLPPIDLEGTADLDLGDPTAIPDRPSSPARKAPGYTGDAAHKSLLENGQP